MELGKFHVRVSGNRDSKRGLFLVVFLAVATLRSRNMDLLYLSLLIFECIYEALYLFLIGKYLNTAKRAKLPVAH